MRTHLGLPAVVITGVSSGPFASGPTNRGEGVEGVIECSVPSLARNHPTAKYSQVSARDER